MMRLQLRFTAALLLALFTLAIAPPAAPAGVGHSRTMRGNERADFPGDDVLDRGPRQELDQDEADCAGAEGVGHDDEKECCCCGGDDEGPTNCEDPDAGALTPADAPRPEAAHQTIDQPESEALRPHVAVPRAAPLTPRMLRLRDELRETLGHYHQRHLNTRDHNPWEVMHSIVAYGAASQLNRNGPDGPVVNSISWLCWNGDCKGTRILEISDGRLAARKGPQVQGHPGQLLAILAQGRVATDCPIKVGNERFTLDDLIESEKLGCQQGIELTFKLIALSYYLDIDARWKSSAGQNWSIERLVHEELGQPIVGAACGGTHRLMGLAYAVRKREASGRPMTGDFRRAQKYLNDYHNYAFNKLQNSDGSFSTEWFKAPGARPDLGRRIQTTGHILEWLSYSLPESELQSPRVVKAVDYLTGVLHDNPNREWEIGPLGHALHALAIYDSRVFKPLEQSAQDDDVAVSPGEPSLPPDEDLLPPAKRVTKTPTLRPAQRVGRRGAPAPAPSSRNYRPAPPAPPRR